MYDEDNDQNVSMVLPVDAALIFPIASTCGQSCYSIHFIQFKASIFENHSIQFKLKHVWESCNSIQFRNNPVQFNSFNSMS